MNTPTESTPTEDRSTRPVNFIHFHGLHDGVSAAQKRQSAAGAVLVDATGSWMA